MSTTAKTPAATLPAGLLELLGWEGGLEATPEPLGGGITNHNLRVRFGGRDVVVRLAGKDTGLLGIDRTCEREATAAAAAVDLGDAVCFAIAGRDPAAGRAAVQGILSGGAAALVGAWAVRRFN